MNRNPISLVQEGMLFLGSDLVGLFLAFNVAHQLRVGGWLSVDSWSLVWLIAVVLIVMYIFDVYHSETQESYARLAARTVLAVVVAGVVNASLVYVVKPWEANPLFWRGILPVSMVMFLIWATVWRLLISRWMQSQSSNVRWLVLGGGDRALHFWRDFMKQRASGVLFFLTEKGQTGNTEFMNSGPKALGTLGDLDKYLRETWTGVVTAMETPLPNAIISSLMNKRLEGLRVYDLTDFYERFLQKLPVINLQDGWFAMAHGFDLLHHEMGLRIKRLIDVVFSIILMFVLLPLMVFVGICIILDSRGPVLYGQMRTGLNGKEFMLHKFRTMVKDAENKSVQWAQQDDPRVTRVGRILRSMRIDELPQLWNVLLGEMSFIGPRPERPDFNRHLEKTIPYYDLRHLVKPGITGWAQVMYPYGASVDDAREKLQYDLYYIKNYSLMLDLVIATKTIRVVLFGQGR